jgi:hypothetical protein
MCYDGKYFDDETFVAGAALVVSAIHSRSSPRCNGILSSLQPQISIRQERAGIFADPRGE